MVSKQSAALGVLQTVSLPHQTESRADVGRSRSRPEVGAQHLCGPTGTDELEDEAIEIRADVVEMLASMLVSLVLRRTADRSVLHGASTAPRSS